MDAPRVDALDAPRIDAGPTDPGWAALPDLPAGCIVEQAEHPERLPTLEWTSCGAGCVHGTASFDDGWAPAGSFVDGDRGVATLVADTGDGWTLYEVVPIDAPAAAAWRFREPGSSPYCSVRFGAVGEGWFSVVVHYVGDPDLARVEERIQRGPLDRSVPASLAATLVFPRVGGGRTADALAVSAELVVAQLSGGSVVVAGDGALTDVFGATPFSGGYWIGAAGDHVVFAETVGEWRLMHWTPETGTEPYFDPPEGVGEPRLHDGVLTWTQQADLVDGRPTRAELWAAPFVRDPATLEPRLVSPSVEPAYALFADGIYGYMTAYPTNPVMRLIDVATGAVRELRPPPGLNCDDRGAYVSRGEVMLECWVPDVSYAELYRLDPRVFSVPL